MSRAKRVHIGPRTQADYLHVEAPGCIINVWWKLTDDQGRPVTRVSISADDRADERWECPDLTEKLGPEYRQGIGVRVIRVHPAEEAQPAEEAGTP